MPISLIKEETEHILRVLPLLIKRDEQFRGSLYTILGESFVKKDDFSELRDIVKELAVAQKRTEARMEELAVAQKKTENELQTLTKTVKAVQKELGGISHVIGYELEEKFYLTLPEIIKEDFGAEFETLERRYLVYPDGRDDEINIYAEGSLNGEKIYLIGESKTQLGKGDIDDFVMVLKRAKNHLKEELLPIFLCYMVHPNVESYLKEKYPQIKVYKSFELKKRASLLHKA